MASANAKTTKELFRDTSSSEGDKDGGGEERPSDEPEPSDCADGHDRNPATASRGEGPTLAALLERHRHRRPDGGGDDGNGDDRPTYDGEGLRRSILEERPDVFVASRELIDEDDDPVDDFALDEELPAALDGAPSLRGGDGAPSDRTVPDARVVAALVGANPRLHCLLADDGPFADDPDVSLSALSGGGAEAAEEGVVARLPSALVGDAAFARRALAVGGPSCEVAFYMCKHHDEEQFDAETRELMEEAFLADVNGLCNMVSQKTGVVSRLPPLCRDNRQIVLSSIHAASGHTDGWNLAHASERLRDDLNFLKEIDELGDNGDGWDVMDYASDRIKTIVGDRDLIDVEHEDSPVDVSSLSEELLDNPNAVIELVCRDQGNSPAVFRRASERLKGKRWFVLQVIEANGLALEHVPEKFRGDRDIVLASVRQNGTALAHAPEEFRGDRDVVLASVRQNGTALAHAPRRFREDGEIALAAIEQDQAAVAFVPRATKEGRGVLLARLARGEGHAGGISLGDLPAEARSDRRLVLAAIEGDGGALRMAADDLRTDRDFLVEALMTNADAWSNLPSSISSDEEVELALALVNKHVRFHYKRLPDRLRDNPRVVVAAMQQACPTFPLVDASPATRKNREIILKAVKMEGYALKYASDELKEDPGIVAAAVASDWNVFKDISSAMKRNKAVAMAALRSSRLSYMMEQVVGELEGELRDDPEVFAAAVGSWTTKIVKDSFASNAGPVLKKRLGSAIYGLKNLAGASAPRVATYAEQVEEWVGRMKHEALERLWLLQGASGGVLRDNRDIEKHILEYANIPGLFKRANSVLHCAPLLVAWGNRGIGWKEMSTKKRKR